MEIYKEDAGFWVLDTGFWMVKNGKKKLMEKMLDGGYCMVKNGDRERRNEID